MQRNELRYRQRKRLARWPLGFSIVATLTSFGCAEYTPPKTPREALQRGQPMAALQMVHYGTPEEKATVIRTILQPLDPEVTIAPVSDDELLKGLDGSTVRQIRRLGIVVRVMTTKKPTKADGYSWLPFSTDVAIEGPDAVLWQHGTNGLALSAFTGERYPLAHSETHWQSGKGFDIRTPGDVILGAILFPVLILSALPSSETKTIPPTKEEIWAAAPRAARAEERFASSEAQDRHVEYTIFRKPVDPHQPFEMKIAVSVGHGMELGRAAIKIPLPPAAAIEERIRLAGSTRRLLAERDIEFDTDGSSAGNHWCSRGSYIAENGLESSFDKCKSVALVTPRLAPMPSIGLELPKRPANVGSFATSQAKRPAWAGSVPWYSWPVLELLPQAKADADARFLACQIDVPRDKQGRQATSVTIENHAVGDRRLSSSSSRREELFFPLILLPAKGSMNLVFKNENTSKIPKLVVQRNGAELQAQFDPPSSAGATCVALDREGLEMAFTSAWATANDAIEAAAHSSIVIRPDESDLGYVLSPLSPLGARVADCAAWVGWDDPRVVELLERRDRQEKRFGDSLVEALKGLATQKVPPNPRSRLRIGAATVTCAGPGNRCRIVNPTENVGDQDELTYHSPVVIFADGRHMSVQRPFDRIAPKSTKNLEIDFERPDVSAVPLGIFMQDGGRVEARLLATSPAP